MKWIAINLALNFAVLAAKLKWVGERWQRERRWGRHHGVTGTDHFQPGADAGMDAGKGPF